MQLPDTPNVSAHRVIHSFLREAKLLAKLRIPGVIQIYDAFQWGGTVYASTEFFPEAVTLERALQSQGTFSPQRTVRILAQIAETLAEIHEKGYLHRDIKPSNILLLPGDEALLIDFGAAREWQADATLNHTALFTPGYAPIEQLGEKGRRGPASDIYSLAATGYEMLTGAAPISAVDRVSGVPLRPISNFRNDAPDALAYTIEKSLALKANDRPQTAHEFLSLIEQGASETEDKRISALQAMDEALAELKELRVGRNECPSCGELLEEPKPLKPGICPVCRAGRIKSRELEEKLCAVCRAGILREEKNFAPMRFCPICRFGQLESKGFLNRRKLSCNDCHAEFTIPARGELRLEKYGSVRSELAEEGQSAGEAEFWLPMSERAETVLTCEGCRAQFDLGPQGRMTLIRVFEDPFSMMKHHKTLAPEEWARVAARLPLDAGNFVCEKCAADYYIENGNITLIDANADTFGFVSRFQGRLLKLEQIPWIAVGKQSGAEGLVCSDCQTEFDNDGSYLRLRGTTHRELIKYVDQARPLEDWHRLARGLPTAEDEDEYMQRFRELLRLGLAGGELHWGDDSDDVRWSGQAELLAENSRPIAKGKLRISSSRVEFISRSHGFDFPLDAVLDIDADGDELRLRVAGRREWIHLIPEPVELTVDMESGRYDITLRAADCAEAISMAMPEKIVR